MKRQDSGRMSLVLAFLCLLCIAMGLLHGTEGRGRAVRTLQLKEAYDTQRAYKLQKEAYKLQKSAKEYIRDLGKNNPGVSRFVLWGEEQGVSVGSPLLNRSAAAALVTVCGDSGIIFASSQSLEDKALTLGASQLETKDGEGLGNCLISPALAYELFGDGDGSGQWIELGQGEFQVKGMLDCQGAVVVVSALFNQEAKLDKVSVKIPAGTGPGQGINDFIEHTGIQGQTLAFHLYSQWAEFMANAVPFLLFFVLWLQMLKKIRKSTLIPALRTLMFLAAAMAGALIALWTMDIHMEIPREMLPNMWSDFKFWSDLWKSQEPVVLAVNSGAEYPGKVSPRQLDPCGEICVPWNPEYDTWHDCWSSTTPEFSVFVVHKKIWTGTLNSLNLEVSIILSNEECSKFRKNQCMNLLPQFYNSCLRNNSL